MIKKDLLKKSVEEYNKFHGAEAQAEVLKHYVNTKGHLLVRFRGLLLF